MSRRHTLFALTMLLITAGRVNAAALDDIKIDVSHEPCKGAGEGGDDDFIVYASNLNATRAIDAEFKYDSNPARQHFILFDANLNPINDRFPKTHTRRIAPKETARIGCTFTYRAAPLSPGPLRVPIVITGQNASYVDPGGSSVPREDPRSFAAFLLQGGIGSCGAGAKPPGLLYLTNLHPYARLSASMNLLDAHGNPVGVLTRDLSPFAATRVACSNGAGKPGPLTSVTLEASLGVVAIQPAGPPADAQLPPPAPSAPKPRAPEPIAATLVPFSLGTILTTQNVCAGSVPTGWIKINDAWNPTVCGRPTTIIYNVWTIQRLSDQAIGAVIYACKGAVPAGWVVAGTAWNPTVCGHPSANESNIMAIKRLN